jgi:hypothetical protein
MNFKLMIQSAVISVLCTLCTVFLVLTLLVGLNMRDKSAEDTPLPCFVVESGKRNAIADSYILKDGCVVYSLESNTEKVCCGDCNVTPFPRRVCDAALMEMTKSELPSDQKAN